MTWRAYPKCKDSGIKWLGEIPEGWEVKRLKHLSSVNDEVLAETTDPDYEIRYVDISNVDAVLGIEHKESMTFGNAPSRARRSVKHGDIIISTVRSYLRAITPIDNPESNLIVSTGFAVIRPKNEFESQFAFHALRAAYFVDTVVANSVGVSYPAINASELVTFYIALPPKSEQRAIAAFLDRETARIDKLIEKKERKIELLHEKRSALISHAVTKGLDANAPMKDSGIEWLGQIPVHWISCPVKRVSIRIQTGCTPPTEEERYYKDGTVPWYGPGSFGTNLVLSEAVKLLNEAAIREGAARLFASDSIMVVCIGATIGKVGYLAGPASSNQQITAITPNPRKVSGKFLAYQLKSLEHVLCGIAPSTTLPIMDQQEIGYLPCALPKLEEQNIIIGYLDRLLQKSDAMTEKILESITMLREYRTALISAAVTGKIDVRGKDGKTVEMEEKVGRSGGRYDSC